MKIPILTVSGFVSCALAPKQTNEKTKKESALEIKLFFIDILCRPVR